MSLTNRWSRTNDSSIIIIVVYYSGWCLIITALSKHPAESLASTRPLDFVNLTFCTLFNHCNFMQLGWGGQVCSETKMENYSYLFYFWQFCATIARSLVDWVFPTAPAFGLRYEFTSVFSAPDISTDLKHGCVLCGDGSRLLALDILVLCLLYCFTARYKAKMPRKTWGHNSKNVIIQRMEAFSFLLITPVMLLLCFYSLPPAAFLICCLFVNMTIFCLSVTLTFTTKNGKVWFMYIICSVFKLKRRG